LFQTSKFSIEIAKNPPLEKEFKQTIGSGEGEMFYSTNQSYHWKSYQSEVAISGRLTNQKSGKKKRVTFEWIFRKEHELSDNDMY
jgi:hypothetical protein